MRNWREELGRTSAQTAGAIRRLLSLAVAAGAPAAVAPWLHTAKQPAAAKEDANNGTLHAGVDSDDLQPVPLSRTESRKLKLDERLSAARNATAVGTSKVSFVPTGDEIDGLAA